MLDGHHCDAKGVVVSLIQICPLGMSYNHPAPLTVAVGGFDPAATTVLLCVNGFMGIAIMYGPYG